MGRFWPSAEPYLRAVAYLVDEAQRENIPVIHDHLKKAEVSMAHVLLDYLLAEPNGEPVEPCPETIQAIQFILSRLNDLSIDELKALATSLQAECKDHVS